VHAHIAGDGLLVNLLCHTAIDRAQRLANADRLLLGPAELAWMSILALYWMVDPHERYGIVETIKKLPQADGEDSAVARWIQQHAHLVEHPLLSSPELFQQWTSLPWPTFLKLKTPRSTR